MPQTILFEAHNLTLTAGTGIATYARHLSHAARRLGYGVQALVGIESRIDQRDPVLGEIQLYDVVPSTRRQWITRSSLAVDFLVGSPFGIKPFRLPSQGLVIQPSPAQFAPFDDTFAAPFLFDRGRLHFQRWGQFAKVKPLQRPDLFHATHPTALRVEGCPNIVTIHDIVPLRLPYATLDDKKLTLRLLRALCQRADHIVTVSEFSKRDIMSFFNVREDRITNTYQSVSIPQHLAERNDDDIAAELRNEFELDLHGYFLFFGAIEPKKNVRRLVEAYSSSGVKAPLLIVGALGWQYEADLQSIEDERFTHFAIEGGQIRKRKRVHRLPYVPFPQLVALIKGARAVVFPSIYEGFGLPVLEAMSLGVPVITSNVSSLPEVAGDAALLVDPMSVEAMSRAIRTLDEDADLRAELSRRGPVQAEKFSPENYERRIEALYKQLLS